MNHKIKYQGYKKYILLSQFNSLPEETFDDFNNYKEALKAFKNYCLAFKSEKKKKLFKNLIYRGYILLITREGKEKNYFKVV